MISALHLKVSGTRLKILAFAISACFLSRPGQAQQQMLASPGLAARAEWVAGPTKVTVAGFGGTGMVEIAVPQGYQFMRDSGARVVLAGMNNPIPKNLIGIFAPVAYKFTSDKWLAILQFDEVGYVNDADQKRLDTAAILKLVRESIARQGGEYGQAVSLAGKAVWELLPAYDPAQHKLEWAVRVDDPKKGGVNHYLSFLGRHGVLNVTASHPNQADIDFASLRAFAAGIVFKPGERYADHQAADKPAPFGLAGVIDPDVKYQPAGSVWKTAAALARSYGVWVVAALGLVLASCGLTVLALKSRKKPRHRINERENSALTMANGHSNGHTNGHPAENGLANNRPLQTRRNGRMAGRVGGKRKKHFSYHAFYSDMVMNLTRCNYGGATRSLGGDDSTNANGAPPASEPAGHPMPGAANLLVAETSKLIQSQQKLIEGQRKLIEEQGKLIQEKSKLIDVENRVLEKQSEMLVEQQLL